METELLLIRHGHAVRVDGNYARAPITALGRRQAELTGERLCAQDIALDGFYTSPLRRTRETSIIIGAKTGHVPDIKQNVEELKGLEVPFLVLMEFLERVGWFDFYLYDNIGKPLNWPIVGRVSKVVTALLEQHRGKRFAIVTHSGVISSVLAWYFPDKRRRWWTYVVDNCSLTRLKINGTRAELMVVNDTNHLSDSLTTTQPPAANVELANKAEQKIERAAAALTQTSASTNGHGAPNKAAEPKPDQTK